MGCGSSRHDNGGVSIANVPPPRQVLLFGRAGAGKGRLFTAMGSAPPKGGSTNDVAKWRGAVVQKVSVNALKSDHMASLVNTKVKSHGAGVVCVWFLIDVAKTFELAEAKMALLKLASLPCMASLPIWILINCDSEASVGRRMAFNVDDLSELLSLSASERQALMPHVARMLRIRVRAPAKTGDISSTVGYRGTRGDHYGKTVISQLENAMRGRPDGIVRRK